jgi:hypothetical protein
MANSFQNVDFLRGRKLLDRSRSLKIGLPFTIVHVRELKFDNKQHGSATYLVCFRPGSDWGPWPCEAHVMTTTLQKLAWWSTSSVRCEILLFSFSVNKTPNACFCPGSNWGPCARKAHVMTVKLHKQAHAYLLTYIKIYLTTLAIHNIFVKIQWVNFRCSEPFANVPSIKRSKLTENSFIWSSSISPLGFFSWNNRRSNDVYKNWFTFSQSFLYAN